METPVNGGSNSNCPKRRKSAIVIRESRVEGLSLNGSKGELRGANPSTRGLGWANLWSTGCYANSSAGQLSWYGRTAAQREILLYTSSRTRFLNRTSIGERCYNQQEGIYYDETFGPVIKMATEDIKHVALRSPIGIYSTKVMPFGLKNAGATYQRAMTNIFKELLHHEVECYVDDLVLQLDRRKKPGELFASEGVNLSGLEWSILCVWVRDWLRYCQRYYCTALSPDANIEQFFDAPVVMNYWKIKRKDPWPFKRRYIGSNQDMLVRLSLESDFRHQRARGTGEGRIAH
ncbi:Retrovirus-related Pol polyprotein from transposon [Sesamum angolense]|uniref:Retrovirus-related Pol polyprotein from transposon n=1 Tax=Sesamum angolense TaxID=2727404 RepID=A0AAE1VUB0_9LAMI|nr:Retrovirus-related Pol polyprotein from transposon [Sesamum angolense]